MESQKYRPPQQLPASLRDTLKIILEEELYLSGLDLLTSLISQGTSSIAGITTDTTTITTTDNTSGSTNSTTDSPGILPPIYIPPPIHLTLFTTLLCHPDFTTHISKRSDKDAHLVPAVCERFLLRILSLAGPGSMDLHSAWSRWNGTLSGLNGLWGGGGGRKGMETSIGGDDAFEDNALDLKIAGKESLFDRAEDFWAVVGWAFSCACAEVGYGVDVEKAKAMRRRWGAWRRVLRVVIEGLERDWSCRIQEELGEKKEKIGRMRKSLIVRWLPSKMGGAGYKRVMRAIMANGKGRLGMEWKEIWRNEAVSLKGIKQQKAKTNLKKLVPLTAAEEKEAKIIGMLEDSSTDEQEDDDEDDDEVLPNSEKRQDANRKDIEGDTTMGGLDEPTGNNPKSKSAANAWGGIEAVSLRQRLLILLSSVCHHQQWIPLGTLHDELTDHLLATDPSSLCLPSIRLFTTVLVDTPNPTYHPPPPPMTTTSHTYLTSSSPPPSHIYLHPLFSSLLRTLLSSEAPPPSIYGTTDDDIGTLIHPEILKQCYLPFSAKTRSVKDNWKLAVILDHLVRAIAKEQDGVEGLVGDDGGATLVIALEDGIEKRTREVLGDVVRDEEDIEGEEKGGGKTGGGRQRVGWKEWELAEERLREVVEAICS